MTTTAIAGQGASVTRPPLPPQMVMNYRLVPDDALEWERRDPAARKTNRRAQASSVLGGMMLLGVTARHLPPWLSSLHSNAVAVAILCLPLGLALLVQRFNRRKRAAERVAAPVDVELQVWDRRLSEKRADRKTPVVMGPEAMRGVIETQSHIFLYSRNDTIILPVTAFPDAKAKDMFAEHWEKVAG